MTDQEWTQLTQMRDCIHNSSPMAFDSQYMESYATLLAKSLEGKGDPPIHHGRQI